MRSNNFNRGGSLSPERYLKNKQYFDLGLINTVEDLQNKNSKLKLQNQKLQETIINRSSFIKSLTYKLKHFKVDNYNLRQRLFGADNDVDTLIKEQNDKYDKLDKKIDGELTKAYDDLIKIYDEHQKLKDEVEKLRNENNKLNKIIARDSQNSNFSSTQDIHPKRPKKVISSREKTDKSVGGQTGHELHKSKLNNSVDRVIERTVSKAPTGAIPIYDEAGIVLYYATQEIDAKMETFITETRYYISCEAIECPPTLLSMYKINPVTYSNSFVSMVLYLNSKGTIPLDRLCIILNELTENKIDLKPSTIVTWSERFKNKAQPILNFFLQDLLSTRILYVDESGWKVDGVNHWVHVLCSEYTSLFMCTKTRSGILDGPISYLNKYTGYLVHDHYMPYYTNLIRCKHVECNAHIMRYLNAGIELDKNMGCAKLKLIFQTMLKERKELMALGHNKMSEERIAEFKSEYIEVIDKTLEKYYRENPNLKKDYEPGYVNLLKRLKVYSTEHFRFVEDFSMPFDNNQAERMIRGIKTKKKVSGQSKNLTNASNYAAIHSINKTCILREMNTLKTIEAILRDEDPFNCFS